jgi:hypothetical protein
MDIDLRTKRRKKKEKEKKKGQNPPKRRELRVIPIVTMPSLDVMSCGAL